VVGAPLHRATERSSDRRNLRRSIELDWGRICPAHTRTHARAQEVERDISSPRTCKSSSNMLKRFDRIVKGGSNVPVA
jgi:hypothetical protein